MGGGMEPRKIDIAGAERLYWMEGTVCGAARGGVVALPGSKPTSGARGSHRTLGGLVSGRRRGVLRAEYGGPHREGEEPKPMMHGHEKVGPRHSSCEA